MSRTKKYRFIQMAPHFSGFKPYGSQRKNATEVIINLEEYEALKLCDYELLTQLEAAKIMKVSRPTLTRIYESARRKIAQAFIEGTVIHFEGGNVKIAKWYRCDNCKITFSLEENSLKKCPLCKKRSVKEND